LLSFIITVKSPIVTRYSGSERPLRDKKNKRISVSGNPLWLSVEATGFEPAASASRTKVGKSLKIRDSFGYLSNVTTFVTTSVTTSFLPLDVPPLRTYALASSREALFFLGAG
jgi:hypothetical protein